ncbi:MAG: FtsP/CotA-like multicopper oxidase with cupredoxin domain [Myxococcota bacterium]
MHWHGPRDVPFAMDGVPWLSEPVPPGGRFEYSFTLTHAGTFWYHPHFDTERQVDLGLYGALVVEDSAEPTTDHDQVWVFDAMGEEAAGDLHHHGFEPLPSQWTVNGQDNPLLAVTGGEVVRARLINVSNTGYLRLTWPDARQIAGGQGLLPSPVPVEELVLGPGERAEIELTPGESEQVLTTLPHSLAGPSAFGDPSPLVTLARTGAAPVTGPEWGSGPLSPSPDPGTTDVVYVFQGDERTGEWRINGEAFPEVTIETLPLGADAVIEVRNLSPSHHPFHLHGLHFELLSRNGVAPPQVMVADTLDLAVRDVVRLRVVADNPGDWMAHCHILPHAEGGMMTVLRVE